MLASGVLPLLEEMILNSESHGSATALYLNLSCLDEAKPMISATQAVPFLIQLLGAETEPQCKLDALHALYNLSTHPANIPNLLAAGIISSLQTLLTDPADNTWIEKSLAVVTNLASNKLGKDEIILAPGLISGLATLLDVGEAIEQEQAVACLLILCNGSEKCSQMVLQEGVIPALVSISVNGTSRGKEKAQKLLMLFREQRQREASPVENQIQSLSPSHHQSESSGEVVSVPVLVPFPSESRTLDTKPLESRSFCKSISRRKVGKAWNYLWKSKNYSSSVYQY